MGLIVRYGFGLYNTGLYWGLRQTIILSYQLNSFLNNLVKREKIDEKLIHALSGQPVAASHHYAPAGNGITTIVLADLARNGEVL